MGGHLAVGLSAAGRLAAVLLAGLLQRLLVLAIVATGVFVLLEIAEGDAVDAWLAATGAGDAGLAATLREAFGLSAPLPVRFADYLWRVATLDLGQSIAFGRPVVDVIAERLPVTLLVMGSALLATAVLGTLLGIRAARRPGGLVDGAVGAVVLALNATPGFLLALVGLVVFAVELRWLPVGGLSSFPPPEGRLAAVLDTARHLVLPVATLTLTYLALYVRLARSSLVETARQDYVRTARAKGVGGARLLRRHLLRPALVPLATLFGVQASAMLGGSVVVETVFAVPGFGSLAAMAVVQRDTLLLAGVILCGAVLVILANLVVDFLYALLDPRVRAGRPAPEGG
jgi:peptide/nickel transport system permease protein